MKEIKYDWFEFGVYGLVRCDQIKDHIAKIKECGLMCTSVYWNRTIKEMFEY